MNTSDPTSLDISELDKAEVLIALYNNSKQQGLGFMDSRGRAELSREDATNLLTGDDLYFDYLYGRVMKVDLNGDILRTGLYDRDNGTGAAYKALEPLLNALASTRV